HHSRMSTPQDQLIQGVECLRPLMEENGFQFSLGEAGKGSGGGFATGQFTSGDRALSAYFSDRGRPFQSDRGR
ncbi:MAG TPA: hypothetical protein VGA59_00780, partial [Ramlibacter sp.]